MYNITMSEEQVSKLLDHIESMIDMCDDDQEVEFYKNWMESVIKSTTV